MGSQNESGQPGAILFAEFWKRASKIREVWKVPFDPGNPIHTPRGLNLSDKVATEIARAIADAVEVLQREQLPRDTANGDALFALAGHEHIPLQGGDGSDGVSNALDASFVSSVRGSFSTRGTVARQPGQARHLRVRSNPDVSRRKDVPANAGRS
ncbi:MAG TPA: hypothetical protein VFB37_00490 [Steroidobacteraceae bacterium]|nr:hypothetical protein [Steroidobacteraceae bacterium]